MRYIILALMLLLGVSAQAAQQETVLAGRHVVYWTPDQPARNAPVILFSHGFTGCATQSTFLTDALAKAGYFVFAPDHADASCKLGAIGIGKPEVDFNAPDKWQDSTYVKRRDDIKAVLAAIKTDPRFKDQIDFSQLGLVGHSLGGYTMMGLAGAWPKWQMTGIKAVLTLSPYATPYWQQGNLGKLHAPIMFQGGTLDKDLTPFLTRRNGVYDQSPAPKYFVEFEGASHLAWTDLHGADHDLMNAYAVAFLNHYVRGMQADAVLTTPQRGITALRYDSELGKDDLLDLPQTTVQKQVRK